MTDKASNSGNSGRNDGSDRFEKGGYQPTNEGYVPRDERGYTPTNQGGTALPKAPTGGTGKTTPAVEKK